MGGASGRPFYVRWRPFYVREAKWYSFYRNGVFAAMRDANNQGAERFALIAVRPHVKAMRTCMEFPAIMEDLQFACENEKAPFWQKKKEVIPWNSISELRVDIDMLKDVLEEHSKSSCKALVISCSDTDQARVLSIIEKHNQTATARGLKQAGTFWATAGEVYAHGLAYDPTPPIIVMWWLLVLLALFILALTFMVGSELPQIAFAAWSRGRDVDIEVCSSESAAECHKPRVAKDEKASNTVGCETEIAATKQRLEECRTDLRSNLTARQDMNHSFTKCGEAFCKQSKSVRESWSVCYDAIQPLHICPLFDSHEDLSQPTSWCQSLWNLGQPVVKSLLYIVASIVICLVGMFIWWMLVKGIGMGLGLLLRGG